jgi:reactive chlorine resistance protein C
MFGTTLSFLFSTPAARTRTTKGVPILSDVGQFLIKDVILIGVSVLTLGESLHQHAAQSR